MVTIDTANLAATMTPPRLGEAARQVEKSRDEQRDSPQTTVAENKMQPEELLQQIKAITEEGTHSVRFEKDNSVNELIVKIVDRETDEIIRQIPPEELVNLSRHLQELSGNIINTAS